MSIIWALLWADDAPSVGAILVYPASRQVLTLDVAATTHTIDAGWLNKPW